ncbi:MAG: hypothetical protein AAF466_10680 [Bacteroidota bacterium]
MSIPLNKYIGAIVSQITESRAEADYTAAQIAKVYAKDSLLKNFAVPRFRAPEIEITIPVALENIEEKPQPIKDVFDNRDFNSKTYQTLKNVSKKESFDRKTSVAIQKLIADKSSQLELELKSGKEKEASMEKYSKAVSNKFMKLMKKDDPKLSKHVRASLQENLSGQIVDTDKRQELDVANVIVEASKLKEVDPRTMIQIKVKLNEEGLEWHQEEGEDGNMKSMLLPE